MTEILAKAVTVTRGSRDLLVMVLTGASPSLVASRR